MEPQKDAGNILFDWAKLEQLADVCDLEMHTDPRWPHPPSFFAECIERQRVLIARDGDKLVGYLLYQVIWGNTAFVSLLRVLPSHQRRGIGKGLIRRLERRLLESGFNSYVTSSESINPNTKKFFPDLGFVAIGELQMNHGGEMFYLKRLT
jgi:ribosomal protein S18 acetylase RimI-like enzyme